MLYKDMTPEQKKERNRSNAASRNRYESKTYDKLTLRVRQDGADGFLLDNVRRRAQEDGESVNAWIAGAIKARLYDN